MEIIKADICVIGAGSGGLTVAAGAAQLGRKVVLIERGKMGGDCLNTGCVPSKSLIAAANRAHAVRESAPLGIRAIELEIDGTVVRVASLADIIRSKEIANRPKDRATLPILYALQDEIARGAAK